MTVTFSRNVPRRVRAVVLAGLELCDEKFEVTGGVPALQKALGHDSPSATRAAIAEAESWGLMRRKGPLNLSPRPVFVVVSRLIRGSCATQGCLAPAWRVWCPTCMQANRADRVWRYKAIDLAVAGNTPPAIAAMVSRPLRDVVRVLLGEVPDMVAVEWRDVFDGRPPDRTAGERQRRSRARKKEKKQNGNEEKTE